VGDDNHDTITPRNVCNSKRDVEQLKRSCGDVLKDSLDQAVYEALEKHPVKRLVPCDSPDHMNHGCLLCHYEDVE
jgi:hypothetical protein